MSNVSANFQAQGFAVVSTVIDRTSLAAISDDLGATPTEGAGSRGLLRHGWCQTLATKLRSVLTAQRLLPEGVVAIQCTLFDKGPTKNWLVALHQDRSIPVRGKVAASELSGWSEKEGDIFVQPPVAVLEQLTAVRLHIDDCPAESGALRVVPGSHANGVLSQAEAEGFRARHGEVVVPAAATDALLMKPLILHASSKATSHVRRRVLHFVYGPKVLPFGLGWQHAI
jgi:ectoine hydroxylase-related dioxygenase (phytanoyl-CoA dioxygenase family)